MRRPTILSVSDHDDGPESMSSILRPFGFDVAEAATGRAALAAVAAVPPDLVLLDVRLPDFSGFEVCRRLRADPATARTPVLFLSGGVCGSGEQAEGLDAGADGFLVGPVDPTLLAAHIRAHLRGRRAEDVLALQNAALGRVVAGAPLEHTLGELARGVEALAPDMMCSVLLLTEDGNRLKTGAAPSLPAAYSAAIDGIAIGPAAGSCGTAVFRRERVVVGDIATDPLWAAFRDLALGHGLRACWSTPVHGRDNCVLATFACYYPDARGPTPDELALIDAATQLTAVVVGRARDEVSRERLESEYRQAQKMEAVGRLAGGVAHDMNNLLTVIVGYAAQAAKHAAQNPKATAAVHEVRKAAEHAAGLTRQLLAFGRKQVVQKRVFDLNGVVRDVSGMLGRVLGEDIDLSVRAAPTPALVLADRGQFEQVLMNLAVNARDAMPTGGCLSVETAVAGGSVRVSVSDTGCGMTEDVKARMFDPFFTTKGVGEGTGLGLAVVHGVVEQFGGRIEVRTAVGSGTTLSITLPRATVPASEWEVPTAPASRGMERVLVVEDEGSVRDLLVQALTDEGYDVGSADGAAAAEAWAAEAGAFDLLVTDVVMPGPSGRVLAERLRARRPGLRVLYMSGFTDDAVVRHGVREDAVHFIHKPFSPEELARKVREVLDAAAPDPTRPPSSPDEQEGAQDA